MKVSELIDQLANFDSETEVNIYYWDHQNKIYISEDFTLNFTRNNTKLYMVQNGQPECMVGGHDDGCMCNLGFTPRWRNK